MFARDLLRDGTQCVDAGHFKDSGAATEIVGTISKIKRDRGDTFKNIKLCVIMISNSPSGSGTAGAAETSSKGQKLRIAPRKPSSGCALPSARSWPRRLPSCRPTPPVARWSGWKILEMEDGEKIGVIDFTLTKKGVPFLLGWSLSKEAAKDIGVQMTKVDLQNTKKKERVIGLPSSATPLAP